MRNEARQGATLIELLVVCALIMGVAALTISTKHLYQRFAASMELEHLYMACRYMQRRAMCTHQEQHLIIDTHARIYCYAGHKHTLAGGVLFGTMPQIKGSPAQPTGIVTQPVTFQGNTIIFYPTGIISSGTLYLTDNARSCCYALSNAVSTVSLLRRYAYKKSWQLIE